MQFSYVQPRFKKVINVEDIQTIHYYDCDETFVFEGERHDFWEMVYVSSGMVEIQRDDETLILGQGSIIFHEPNEFHAIRAYQSSPDFFVMSFVCKSAIMKCFRQYHSLLSNPLRVFVSSMATEAQQAYDTDGRFDNKKAAIKNKDTIGGEQMVKSYLEQLLILLAREISCYDNTSLFPNKESMESRLVVEIKNYMMSKVTDKLDAAEICTYFGYSRAYICRLFKTQCGVSLMQFYIQQKVEYSKQLIQERRHNICQISNMLSFDNPQYFSRVFKRVTGLTPSEYSRSLKLK